MFTLVYINGNFNRPETLPTFLQSNIGKSSLLQVDCVTPYKGTEQELIYRVCEHLNSIDPYIEVTYKSTQNVSIEMVKSVHHVNFMVIQININQR